MKEQAMDLPDVVSQDEWKAAQQQLRMKQKEATRARDAPTPNADAYRGF
jgi:predicted dithiol-disulfide oxidoreductase (DUF899 family)